MIRIEAENLEDAYSHAAKELNCSVMDLSIEVLQNPSKGFLGFFSKKAIITAACTAKRKEKPSSDENFSLKKEEKSSVQKKPNKHHENIKKSEKRTRTEKTHKFEKKPRTQRNTPRKEKHAQEIQAKPIVKESAKKVEKKHSEKPKVTRKSIATKTIFDNTFFKESKNPKDIKNEIKNGLKKLLNVSCFEIDIKNIDINENNAVIIELDGNDAALLIGKEGYRYKALSYMLHNWINIKYNLNIRLEIAEFLKNQEEMIKNYLQPVIEKVKTHGKAQTKHLDGVLIKIALEELRREFPDKYVAIKSSRDRQKFIVVNDFRRNTK